MGLRPALCHPVSCREWVCTLLKHFILFIYFGHRNLDPGDIRGWGARCRKQGSARHGSERPGPTSQRAAHWNVAVPRLRDSTQLFSQDGRREKGHRLQCAVALGANLRISLTATCLPGRGSLTRAVTPQPGPRGGGGRPSAHPVQGGGLEHWNPSQFLSVSSGVCFSPRARLVSREAVKVGRGEAILSAAEAVAGRPEGLRGDQPVWSSRDPAGWGGQEGGVPGV